jgi:hypothetical protein
MGGQISPAAVESRRGVHLPGAILFGSFRPAIVFQLHAPPLQPVWPPCSSDFSLSAELRGSDVGMDPGSRSPADLALSWRAALSHQRCAASRPSRCLGSTLLQKHPHYSPFGGQADWASLSGLAITASVGRVRTSGHHHRNMLTNSNTLPAVLPTAVKITKSALSP